MVVLSQSVNAVVLEQSCTAGIETRCIYTVLLPSSYIAAAVAGHTCAVFLHTMCSVCPAAHLIFVLSLIYCISVLTAWSHMQVADKKAGANCARLNLQKGKPVIKRRFQPGAVDEVCFLGE